MTAANDKRMAAAIGSLGPRSRAIAVLNAIRADDKALADSLAETAPKKMYRCIDVGETATIEAAESMALRFDRSFYGLLAVYWQLLAQDEKQEASERRGEIAAIVQATTAFAESLDIPFGAAFAFSIAIDDPAFSEFQKVKADPVTVQRVADSYAAVWRSKDAAIIQPQSAH